MIFEWQQRCPESSLDLLFPTESGKPVALTNFTISAWQPLMKEAGLIDPEEDKDGKTVQKARYTPYALRHYMLRS
jgi:integrase